MYYDALLETGLRDKEAKIYAILLELGPSPAHTIIKKAALKRGIVYKILYDLEERQLVTKYTENKKLYFKPEHPYNLTKQVENSLLQAQNHKLALDTYLPQLISAFKTSQNLPGVRIYEGIEGIKEVYLDTLREKAEIWAILQTADVEPKLYTWLNKTYAKERAKAGIWAHVIVAQDQTTQEYVQRNEAELRETRIVPKETFPIGVEVDIYGDKIAFIDFKKSNDHIGIIIHNELIANTLKALFVLAWERAGEISKHN